MSFCNRFVLPVVAVLSLTFLIACGSSSHSVTPPPTGGFSNSNLKGTYVFAITGTDAVNATSLSMTGAFTANGTGGNGGIASGTTIDINDLGIGFGTLSITGGSYSVTQDGRGQASLTLGSSTPWGTNSIEVDFVLSTSEQGFITQFDNNGTGSGTLDLQTATSQPAAGTYVLAVSGAISGNLATIAGAISLDGSGTATGSIDYNVASSPFFYGLSSGSNITVSGTPGTATLVATLGPTFTFDIYAIDASHLKFIETDSFGNLAGDLFQQTSSTFPSGQVVFTMAGFDTNPSLSGPVALGGLMTSDGTSTISNGEEDYNDVSNTDSTPQTFSGSISLAKGRYQIALNTFVNGNGAVPQTYTFAAYPYGTGVALVEIDGGGVSAGTAYSQSSTSLASSQGYGLNLSGSNPNGFEDIIAEFTTTSTGFSGGIDVNDVAGGVGLSFDKNFSGNYTMDTPATGRGVFNVTNSASGSNFGGGAIYTISGTQILLLEADSSGQVGLGALEQQNATAASSSLSNSNMAQRHLAVIKAVLAAKNAKKAKNNK